MPSSTRILLVDDSAVLRKLASLTLGGVGGYHVIEAADARTALEVASDERLDAVVCDLSMPGMDGIELVRQLRKRASLVHVPMVMMLGQDEASAEQEARASGVDAFVRKPFEPSALRSVLRSVLAEGARPAPRGAGSIDAQAMLDSIPYPAMVLDAGHNVVLANAAFWRASGTGIGDSCVICAQVMHADGEPAGCPLTDAVRSGDACERRISEPKAGDVIVSVYPMEQTDERGQRLFLHLTRPASA